jgi:hypothetical protein
MRPPLRCRVALALVLISGPGAHAGEPFRSAAFAQAGAVTAAALSGCRGGFTTASGLVVTLGIERIVTVDGSVAARSELRLGDLGRLAGGAVLPAEAAGRIELVRNGAGSLTVRFGPSLLGGTVIQNSLNGQSIGHATIIDASVAAHGLPQTMQFQSTLANALHATAAGR